MTNSLDISETKESIPYDKVYVINMDQATDRWNKVDAALTEAGIEHERFPAVNGNSINLTNLKTGEVISGKTLKEQQARTKLDTKYLVDCQPGNLDSIKFSFLSSTYGKLPGEYGLVPGELGIWCSNQMIWRDAQKNNYSNIIVFEDDILPHKLAIFKQQLKEFITYLPTTYDVGYINVVKGVENY